MLRFQYNEWFKTGITKRGIFSAQNGYFYYAIHNLADVDKQAEDMYFWLVKEYTERQGVTELLKAENPMEWVGRMNNIQACVRETVKDVLICV